MSIVKWNVKALAWQYSSRMGQVLIGAIALTLTPASLPSMGTQLAQVPGLDIQKLETSLWEQATDTEDVVTADVSLDGRRLFSISMPAVSQKQQKQQAPITQRVQDIETILQRIVNRGFDPDELEVTSVFDETSGLPVIYINDQWLMTVTTLDARLQGRDPERWADRLTEIIRDALLRAQQERQPQFLARQGMLAGSITLVVVVTSCGLTRAQRRLRAQQKRLEAEIPTQAEVLPESVSAARPTTSPSEQAETIAAVQQQLVKRQQRNVSDIKLRLLHGAQAGVWGTSVYVVLGLFPQSRWLQPLVVSAPLQVVGIGLLTYVLIRVSDVLVDQLFEALKNGEFLSPEVSQRVALRVSTFSRVFKSVLAIVFTFAGTLTGLSVIGVDLIPLLAGAGIIGLAISFASQSIIKDMINGFLILLEDQYAVGDVIVVGDVSGFVENMNLRITQLRNNEGRLITIPNSAIAIVQNLSKDWSRVDIAIDVAYITDPDRAIEVIRQVGEEMYRDREWQEKMPESPEVLGIDELDHAGILIRVWIKTQPLQQWSVAREFRRRLKLALDQAGIAIGSPQQALWFRSSLDLSSPLLIERNGREPRQLQTTGAQSDTPS